MQIFHQTANFSMLKPEALMQEIIWINQWLYDLLHNIMFDRQKDYSFMFVHQTFETWFIVRYYFLQTAFSGKGRSTLIFPSKHNSQQMPF